MPANQQHDFLLNGKGYMLVRARSGAARSWKRYGVNVSPAGSSPDEGKFNAGPAEIRFAETFDDFSGGFGYAYRTAAPPNGIHWSENMDTRFAGQAVHCQDLVVAAGSGPYGAFLDTPLDSTIGAGAVMQAVHPRGGTARVFRTIPTGLVSPADLSGTQGNLSAQWAGRMALFGSYIYVGAATGNFARYDYDLMNGTLGPIPAQGFVNAGNRLWAAQGPPGRPHQLQSIAAGALGMTSGDWTATINVGNGQNPIKWLESLGGQVFAGLSDGLYAGDQSGTFPNVTGELAGQSSPDNFRDLCIHDGRVIGQTVAGVYSYDPTSTTQARVRGLGPVVRSSKSPVNGSPLAVRSYGDWLHVGLWTGSQSYLLAGRDPGDGPFVWNVLNRLPSNQRINRLHFDGITVGTGFLTVPNRLWLAMGGTQGNSAGPVSAPLYYQNLPRLNGNPLAPAPGFSANYCGSARMVLPRSDRGAPGVLKMYEYAEVWGDAFLSGSRYADVYYAIDGGARTLLGRAQASPTSRLYFTQSNPSFYSGRSIEWDVESYNATPGTCQVYRSIVGYGVMRPTVAAVYDAVVHVGDNVPDRRGTPMRPGRTVIDELRSYEDPNRLGGQILTLIDLAGATQQVVLVPPIAESEFYQDGSRDPEIAASIRLAVLTYSGT